MKPLLALKCPKRMSFDDYLHKIKWPQFATPKIDFLRCYTIPHVAYLDWCMPCTRSGKSIPNHYTRGRIIEECPTWIDGELGAGKTFQAGMSAIMTRDGQPDFTYHVFDCCISTDKIYAERIEHLDVLKLPAFCTKLLPVELHSLDEMLAYEKTQLEAGAEGIMLRPPESGYDTGYADNRATFNVPWLIAIKRFDHGEALIIGFEEAQENTNEQTPDYLGRMKRSSHQQGLFPLGRLGAFIVQDKETKVVFKVGSGFDHDFAKQVWDNRPAFEGKFLRYKWQQAGTKDKPRIPIFEGMRDARDMS